jgi:hypothetical protein
MPPQQDRRPDRHSVQENCIRHNPNRAEKRPANGTVPRPMRCGGPQERSDNGQQGMQIKAPAAWCSPCGHAQPLFQEPQTSLMPRISVIRTSLQLPPQARVQSPHCACKQEDEFLRHPPRIRHVRRSQSPAASGGIGALPNERDRLRPAIESNRPDLLATRTDRSSQRPGRQIVHRTACDQDYDDVHARDCASCHLRG